MGSRAKLVSWTLVLFVLAVILTGCGGSRSRETLGTQAPLSAARVRSAFAHHDLRPKWVFDSRTASEAEINRIAPLTRSKASAKAHAGLLHLVAERNTHPVTWLSYSVPEVFVWRDQTDAQIQVQPFQQALARAAAEVKAHGGQLAGTHVLRIDNVAVIVPESISAEPKALKAALAELAAMK